MALTYDVLATTTFGSNTASVTFSSISQTYTDLRVSVITKGSSNLTISNSGSYRYNTIYWSSSGVGQLNGTGSGNIYLTNAYSFGTGQWGGALIDIFGYAGSNYKTIHFDFSPVDAANGADYGERDVLLWQTTSAITSLTLNAQNNFPANARVTLYGIKAA